MPAVEDIFKALGDPVRVRIIRMLADNGEMCVCNIMSGLGMTQPAISHHLAVLRNAGLVHPRKQGYWVHYSLCKATLSDMAQAFLQDVLDKLEVADRPELCCK